MLYETASAADTLCHLNEWDRCSIPMHALHVGLKNRQLDTVAFFLKSKENGKCHILHYCIITIVLIAQLSLCRVASIIVIAMLGSKVVPSAVMFLSQ